jgi:uncharacterized protein YyaL (SSP411 family)
MQKVTRLLFALIIALLFGGFRFPDAKEKLSWISLSEAEERLKQQKRPVLIDLYTDWCGWCRVMDKKTYSHPEVARYINEKFYPVKIDAESRETFHWKGKTYGYNSGNGVNNYAIYLTRGQLSFPTTVIIAADGSQPQAIPGYLEVSDMEMLLKYFGEGHYGRTAFPDFQKDFRPFWK